MGLGERLAHAWSAFRNREPTNRLRDMGHSTSYRPDRVRFHGSTESSMVAPLYNRIAIDVASVRINHVRVNQNGTFLNVIDSRLNRCFAHSANLDQSGRAFMQDVVMSLFDEGSVAIVPVETTLNPRVTGAFDVRSMRTGKILQWYPQHVKVRVYNERTGEKEDLVLEKREVAIIENPLYAIMNEPNGTLKRLIRKLNLLDVIDEQSGSGKLDVIIQLPYVIKSEARRREADTRRKDLEDQLKGSKLGVGYIDGTERVIQLNRAAENNLMGQIEYLTSMLWSQLGITTGVLDGTASEAEMTNYEVRTIEPVLSAIVDEMQRKFLTMTARTQGQRLMFFRNIFRLLSGSALADVGDKLTRNEIASSNEMRGVLGLRPSDDPRANELRNKNLNPAADHEPVMTPDGEE